MTGWTPFKPGLALVSLALMSAILAASQVIASGMTTGSPESTRILLMPMIAANRPDGPPSGDLDVSLTVKENTGVAASGYPVSAVVPLPRGRFTSTDGLGIAGTPSQVEVLERWPGDASLRNVLVHFQASLGANGNATYHFANGGRTDPPDPVAVTETPTAVTVTTGPLKFVVSKTAFNILDQVWLDLNANSTFEADEQIIASQAQNGGVFVPRSGAGGIQYDTGRADLQVEVEEGGPMRAVIRVEAPARFISTAQHTHGFAVRLYAYAGKPFVKVDYQLQNSDKGVVRSWPLYFEELRLDYRLNLAASTLRFGTGSGSVFRAADTHGAYQAQERHNTFKIYDGQTNAVLYNSGTLPDGTGAEGYVDVSDAQWGVMAAIRNFWQTWPNGLAVDAQNELSVQLFPAWSAQWYDKQINPSGLYWLDDMQHAYKEVLLYFHGPDASDVELSDLARTFQYYPVAVVPTDWYRQTQATLDLGGVIPPSATIPAAPDQRRPQYVTEGFNPEDWYNPSNDYYGAGWVNFWDPEPGYRSASCMHGGWPYGSADTIATGNPADYFTVEGWALGELNLRPEWMIGYRHDADWSRLLLTENPYCGGSWRIFEGFGVSTLAAPPLPGTGAETPVYYARDDQHGWFYHVADAYWLTGNPWIKDWYRFIAEFRRVRLDRLDPFPDTTSRATGHALANVVQAYRITGDATLLDRLATHIRTYLRPEQDPAYGDQLPAVEEGGGGFQTGYLMRAVIDYLEEVRARGDWQAYAEGFNYLSGLMEWNYHFGNFPYYFDGRGGGQGVSSGTALTLVDPQAWYYWRTGKQGYLSQLDQYVTSGINGGETPYGEFSQWSGQFEGRYYLFVKNTPRPDVTPPPAITDLTATAAGGVTTLAWTAPADAVRYHVVWSTLPIVESNSTAPGVRNWWAANAVGPSLAPTPGARQTLTIATGAASPVYAAIFTFDAADNMSAMSNLALTGSVFYVRPDGGSTEQCTGLGDAAYPGSGNDQPCAWDHPFRALPPDGAPRIQGGDTLIIDAGSYMMGYGAPGADACDAGGSFGCLMPPIPSGPDAAHKTRILGAGWDTGCAAAPELWGTERPWFIVNLTDASHVEIGCLEVTDHSPCVEFHAHGLGGSPLTCERDASPYGPWASAGLYAEDATDVYLHDLNIHGLASAGVHAGRLTDWTVEDVRIAGNGWIGWDGDIDGDDANAGTLIFRRWTVEWNGCGETYPGGQPAGCWAQPAGGYGDGVGTGETGGHWIIEDSAFLHNTSDGLDLLYARRPDSQIELHRVIAEGNAGNQVKTNGPVTIESSIIVGNCGYFDDQPFTYSVDGVNSVDNCRAAGNAASLTLRPGNQVTLTNNTLVSEGDCVLLAECEGTCNGSERVRLRNSLIQGHPDFLQEGDVTCLAYQESFPSDPFDFDYSLITGVKDDACPGPHAICGGSAGVVSAAIDAFDGHLLPDSRARDAGTAAGAPAIAFNGQPRDAQPDIGADEYAPAMIPTVIISAPGNAVQLSWTPDPANSEGYEVWWSADPYFVPGAPGAVQEVLPAGSGSYTDTAGGAARYYMVRGVEEAGKKSAPSGRVGIFDFSLTTGSS